MKLLKDVLDKNYLTLEANMDVKEAMKRVVNVSNDDTLIDELYVLDTKKKLIGVLTLKELIIARTPMTIDKIMNSKFHFVYDSDSIAKAIDTVQNYDQDMIPVVSKSHQMVGVLTASEALDLLADETLEDFHKMASLSEYDVHSKPFTRSKKRLPWLIILLVLSLITATILSIFETTIQTVILLVLFQPMILDAAGNISTQSLAKTILHINEDPNHDVTSFLKKELLIGCINSFFVSMIGFSFSLGFLFIFQPNEGQHLMVSIIVGLTLLLALLVGSLTGAFVPLLLRKLHVDPSVASGPFMTTLNDVISLVIYFTLATILLI
jgi:magnesium transporter